MFDAVWWAWYALCSSVWKGWPYAVVAFNVFLLLIVLVTGWRLKQCWNHKAGRVSRLPLSTKLMLLCNVAMCVSPATTLLRHRLAQSWVELGDEFAHLCIIAALFILNVLLFTRRERLGRAVVGSVLLALLAGLPRLVGALDFGDSHENVSVWVFYVAFMAMLVMNVVPRRTMTHRRISMLCGYALNAVFDLCRIGGVILIAGRLMGTSPFGSWSWNRVFIPLWCADALALIGCLHWLLARRILGPAASLSPRSAIDSDSTVALNVALRSWLWHTHIGFLGYSLTIGGVGGAVFKVLLASQLDNDHSFYPWVIAAPLLAQTAVCTAAWLMAMCFRYSVGSHSCVLA